MKIYLYILNTLADWEIGYITAELNSGRFLDKTKPPIQLIKIGNTNESIKTMGGINIAPDECVNNITFEKGDLLILPGADTWDEESNKKIINLIPKLLNQNVIVAAICGATVALAKSGILNKRKHTSEDKEFLKMICPDYSGEENYLNKPTVIDNNLITASGLAPLEFSYEVLKKMNVMKSETLEAWYQLYKTQDAKFFPLLMESLKK